MIGLFLNNKTPGKRKSPSNLKNKKTDPSKGISLLIYILKKLNFQKLNLIQAVKNKMALQNKMLGYIFAKNAISKLD